MVADIPPWEQTADVIKAIGTVLSAVALPGAVAYIVYLLRERVSAILKAIEDRIRAGAQVTGEAGPFKGALGATPPPIEEETRVASEVEAASDRRLPKKPPGTASPPSPRSRGSRRS